jgi:hydroxymethylpyrimidine kinase / phosphomethylpyrimidine kinase / thiamine-phosphate diphosphorylase
MRVVMTVAGSDPIGGAGVQADIKAISSMDLHGCSVITAATSQNTMSVSAIYPFSEREVKSQLDSVLNDVRISAVKTGMLYSREIAVTVCDRLGGVDVPIVVDPVLVAGVGDSLYSKDLLAAFREVVFPIATVITPNRGEAELLLGRKILKEADLAKACRDLASMGPEAVVLKGGHFEGDMATDLLYHNGVVTEFSMPRLDRQVHGGGCTFASFLACGLANEWGLKRSLLEAKRRVHDSIALAYPIGKGISIVNPTATRQKEAMRSDLLSDLDRSVRHLTAGILPAGRWGRASFCHALPNPQGHYEVGMALIHLKRGRMRATSATFGAGGSVPDTLLKLNSIDEHILSALELIVETGAWNVPSEEELDVLYIGPDAEGRGTFMKELARSTDALGKAPDLAISEGDEWLSLIFFGNDPRDILVKVRSTMS